MTSCLVIQAQHCSEAPSLGSDVNGRLKWNLPKSCKLINKPRGQPTPSHICTYVGLASREHHLQRTPWKTQCAPTQRGWITWHPAGPAQEAPGSAGPTHQPQWLGRGRRERQALRLVPSGRGGPPALATRPHGKAATILCHRLRGGGSNAGQHESRWEMLAFRPSLYW